MCALYLKHFPDKVTVNLNLGTPFWYSKADLGDAEPMFATHSIDSVSEGREHCSHTFAELETELWFVLPFHEMAGRRILL